MRDDRVGEGRFIDSRPSDRQRGPGQGGVPARRRGVRKRVRRGPRSWDEDQGFKIRSSSRGAYVKPAFPCHQVGNAPSNYLITLLISGRRFWPRQQYKPRPALYRPDDVD